MSGDETQDVELRELVAQTLEINGVLPKLRAQLRASVFLALEDQEKAANSHFSNKSLIDYVSTREGALVFSLVRELLEYFELDNTLSVFDPETKHGKDYNYTDRSQLLKELKINNVNASKGPLLGQMLHLNQARDLTGFDETVDKLTNPNKNHMENTLLLSNEVKATLKKDKEEKVHLSRSINTLTAESVKSVNRNNDETTRNSLVRNNMVTKSAEHEPMSLKTQSTSGLSLLGNLPPLSGSPIAPVKQDKEADLRKLQKEMVDLGIDSADINYEEDFNSSESGSPREDQSKGSRRDEDQSKGSNTGTEIEEEIMSGIDDGESNYSGPDNMTVDETVSNSSNLLDIANHIEDITRP